MAGAGRGMKKEACEKEMKDLVEEYDYEAVKLEEALNEFTLETTKRIVVMRNLEEQLEGLSRQINVRNPRNTGGLVDDCHDAISQAFDGRYRRISTLDEESKAEGEHWMGRKRSRESGYQWAGKGVLGGGKGKGQGENVEFVHRGWHGDVRTEREQEEYEKGKGRSVYSEKKKRNVSQGRGRSQTRGGEPMDRGTSRMRDVSTTRSPDRGDVGTGNVEGEVNLVESADTGGASSSGLQRGIASGERKRSEERGNKMSLSERLDMSLDEVVEREEEERRNEDSVDRDARRDMRNQEGENATRTLYLHGIETLTEEEVWKGLKIKVDEAWVPAFSLDAIDGQSYTRNPVTLKGTGTAYVRFRDNATRNVCAKMWNKFRITDRMGNVNVLATEDSAQDLFIPMRTGPLTPRPSNEALSIPMECRRVDYEEAEQRLRNARKLEAAMVNERRSATGPVGHGRWHPNMRNILIQMGNCVYCGGAGHRQWDCPEADDDGAPKCGICGRRNHTTDSCRFKDTRESKEW